MKGIYTLVGMKYRHTEGIVKALRGGESLSLRREPDNPHDRAAIMVWYDGKHIAYIKGSEAPALARFMDEHVGEGNEMPARYRITPDRWPSAEVEE